MLLETRIWFWLFFSRTPNYLALLLHGSQKRSEGVFLLHVVLTMKSSFVAGLLLCGLVGRGQFHVRRAAFGPVRDHGDGVQ